jgi:hypothetical protein
VVILISEWKAERAAVCCYQEVVVDERPGLPGDHLRPLRAALAQPLAAPNEQRQRRGRPDQLSDRTESGKVLAHRSTKLT